MPPDPSTDPLAPLLPAGARLSPVDDVFEHYRILRREDGSLWELGHGAMGVTYKAVDSNLGKQVALKIINAQFLNKESSRERFKREARGAASLDHPHVARVYHLGQSGNSFFYAMEYIAGDTIEAIVRRDGPLPWRGALAIASQITRALIALHAKQLVHRDIKPANIMLVDEVDEKNVAKLIDFGLAKSAAEEEAAAHAISNASGFLGTPLYASPEQCEELPADIRSDIYSLGITLWFMLTGHPTFEGNLARVFQQQLHAKPPLEKLPPDLPTAVRTLLEKMLAKDRTLRPQGPAELRQELEACLHPSERPRPITSGEIPAANSPNAKPPLLIVKTKFLAPPKNAAVVTDSPLEVTSPEIVEPFRWRRPAGMLAGVILAALVVWLGWRWLRPPPPVVPDPLAGDTATPAPARPEPTGLSTPAPATPPPPSTQLTELLTRARTAGKTSNHAQVVDAYNAVLAVAPENVEAWEEIGRADDAMHENDKARSALQHAIAIPPGGPRDSCYLAEAYLALNQPDDANKAFAAGEKFEPQDASDHALRGNACFHLQQYDRAIRDFDEVIRLDPKDTNALCQRGQSYDMLGQGERAIQDFDAAIRLNPLNVGAYSERAAAFEKLRQYAPAILDFNRAISLNGRSPDLFDGRAAAEEASGDPTAAEVDRAHAKRLRGR